MFISFFGFYSWVKTWTSRRMRGVEIYLVLVLYGFVLTPKIP
jgi:hypothetical protein